jgi:DNA-binding GntR family transcriptional regulator
MRPALSAATPAATPDDRAFAPLALDMLALLERKIITREFAPGTRLIEADLCEFYKISRTPLREALRLLEASGLVTRRPRYGVHVAPMTIENLDHIYSCRVPLEALAAAALAAAPARDACVGRLASCLQRMQQADAHHELEAGFAANVELTGALHRECGNPVLAAVLAQLDKPALRYRHWAYLEQPKMLPLAIRANRKMIAAIRAGEPARAEAVVRDLVTRAWAMTRAAFLAHPKGLDSPARLRLHGGPPKRGPGRPRARTSR